MKIHFHSFKQYSVDLNEVIFSCFGGVAIADDRRMVLKLPSRGHTHSQSVVEAGGKSLLVTENKKKIKTGNEVTKPQRCTQYSAVTRLSKTKIHELKIN